MRAVCVQAERGTCVWGGAGGGGGVCVGAGGGGGGGGVTLGRRATHPNDGVLD